MASLSLPFCLSYAPSTIPYKCRTASLASSSSHSFRRNVIGSTKISSPSCRNAVISSCSTLVHEVELWTSLQPQLKFYCFLLSPLILVPLAASSSQSRQFLDSTRSWQRWQGVQRVVVHISTLFILSNAFYSDIAAPDPYDTLEDVPPDISGGEIRKRIQRPKSRKAENCTQKCVGTCIRGGAGSPGEGPFNIRNLIECSDICNLIGDGDDGP